MSDLHTYHSYALMSHYNPLSRYREGPLIQNVASSKDVDIVYLINVTTLTWTLPRRAEWARDKILIKISVVINTLTLEFCKCIAHEVQRFTCFLLHSFGT